MHDVFIATLSGGPAPVSRREQDMLIRALQSEGVDVGVAVWDDPQVLWENARLCVLRSCYDWFCQRNRFLAWAEAVSRHTQLLNPLEIVKRYSRKDYVEDLPASLPVIPTLFVEQVDAGMREMRARGWNQVVLKPWIGIASIGIHYVDAREDGTARVLTKMLSTSQKVLAQPLLDRVVTQGEMSVIFIDSKVSHTVIKIPADSAEHRSTMSHEWATVAPICPSEHPLAIARAAMPDSGSLFGRVDLLPGPDGKWLVSEIEMATPLLYFDQCPTAAGRLANAIVRRLGMSS